MNSINYPEFIEFIVLMPRSMSIPPHSVRIQVGVGATPGPECGAQSKQTIYARC